MAESSASQTIPETSVSIQGEVGETALEGLLVKIPVQSERIISEKEFFDILTLAGSLHKSDAIKLQAESGLDFLRSYASEEGYMLSTLRDAAEILEVPGRFVNDAIDLLYPSPDVQQVDIQRHGATPTFKVICDTYRRELMSALRTGLPLFNFDSKYHDSWAKSNLTCSQVIATEETKGHLWWKKTVPAKTHSKLASLRFDKRMPKFNTHIPEGKFNLEVCVSDPVFLRVCGDDLKKLNKHFKDQLHEYNLKYNYVVE